MQNNIWDTLREQHPLIHCITNPISIHQCADAILAVGARPIMAEHSAEAAEITKTAAALLLNTGNITDMRMDAMKISAAAAKQENIPFVLDTVGIACSRLRRAYVKQLLSDAVPTVIKGNYSEINALSCNTYHSTGVDADSDLKTNAVCKAAVSLAQKYHTILLASGKTDIVTDGRKAVYIRNGTAQLSAITGTGCMLGALCACALAAQNSIDAVIDACVMLGICGQLAETSEGSGSFSVNLLNALSNFSKKNLNKLTDTEEISIENL